MLERLASLVAKWISMNSNNQSLRYAETSAVIYLVAPLFVFFAFFVRLEFAVPACALIVYLTYELIRRTSWCEVLNFRWQSLYFLAMAVLWVWLSGGIGPLHQNYDWAKHYVIINFLTQHSWPATDQFDHFGDSTLRYYIGWYLVPSLILKITNVNWPTLVLNVWSVAGLFLFFSLLPGLIEKRWAVIVPPLAFMAFGGADIIGSRITEFYNPLLYHFEWWAGWIQYSSNTTALFWVPQHAIPAWIAVAILMRCRQCDAFLPYCALLGSAVLLWSPFSAIGLTPFLLVLSVHHGLRKIAFDWRAILSVLLLALPIALYLTAGTSDIPHGYIGTLPCIADHPCFTWPSYFLFLLIEIGGPAAILFMCRETEKKFLIAATVALCLLPLYRMGAANDFGMRASLPSLAVLAILCAKLLITAPRPYPITVLVLLLAALPTALGEISRSFAAVPDIDPNTAVGPHTVPESKREMFAQYFAPHPIWILR
jgi:hypothetical protein